MRNRNGSRRFDRSVVIALSLTALAAVGGLAFIVFGIAFVADARESTSWPSTQGEAVARQVRWSSSSSGRGASESQRRYYVEVTYRYNVGGARYTSSRFALGPGSRATEMFDSREQARAAGAAYSPGSPVDVHFDPDDPSSAVLRPGAEWSTYVPLVMGTLLLIGGIVAAVAIIRHNR